MKHLLITTIAAVVLVVNVNVEDNFFNRTPLHHAAIEDQKEIVELLIDNSADVNAKDVNGYTPLDWADDEIVALLRKHGGKTAEELKAEGK